MTGIDRPASNEGPRAEGGLGADEDRALLARLRAGEDAAFGELFTRHCDAVRRMALGVAQDRAEAEDLTAEAFFRVLQAIRRGSGPVDNVRGYLLIVVRRVAWEWNGRRRDVPVSDEELTYRAGADQDTSGQSTERTLITRAFTSLPERWRSVLWKVEVEGERPAVVAGKFGLSPNATAALARRARQGLRAAYLQAHLTTAAGPTGCRSVLEKLGAYTAGSIKGAERRRVRGHLADCPSCASMYDELRDVCSGLRAYAAHLAAPAGIALWQQLAPEPAVGALASIKGLLAGVKLQAAVAAGSAVAVGAVGLAVWGSSSEDTTLAFDDLDSPTVGVVSSARSSASTTTDPASRPAPVGSGQLSPPEHASARRTTTTPADAVPVGTRAETAVEVAPITTSRAKKAAPRVETPTSGSEMGIQATPGDDYDESLPVVYEQSSYQRKWSVYDDREVHTETTRQTKVNSANQTTVVTSTTRYTTFRESSKPKPAPPTPTP